MFCRFSYVLRVGEGVGYSMLEYPRYGTVKSGYKLPATSYKIHVHNPGYGHQKSTTYAPRHLVGGAGFRGRACRAHVVGSGVSG